MLNSFSLKKQNNKVGATNKATLRFGGLYLPEFLTYDVETLQVYCRDQLL